MPIWKRPVCHLLGKGFRSYRCNSLIGTDGESRSWMLYSRLKVRPSRGSMPENTVRDFWSGARVLVTGGAGFLGSRGVGKLRRRQCEEIFVPGSKDFDLRQTEGISRMLERSDYGMLTHRAATLGCMCTNQK